MSRLSERTYASTPSDPQFASCEGTRDLTLPQKITRFLAQAPDYITETYSKSLRDAFGSYHNLTVAHP